MSTLTDNLMRYFLALAFSYCLFIDGYAQKPALDTYALENWPSVGGAKISDDGKYCLYYIQIIVRHIVRQRELVIQRTDNSWRVDFPNSGDIADFTHDSRKAIFTTGGDSLGIIDLTSHSLRYYGDIPYYQLSEGALGEAYVFSLAKSRRTLKEIDLASGKEIDLHDIEDYKIDGRGNRIALLKDNPGDRQQVDVGDISLGKQKSVWEGLNAAALTFDSSGNNLCFLTSDDAGLDRNERLYIYQFGDDSARGTCIRQWTGLHEKRIRNILKYIPTNNELSVEMQDTAGGSDIGEDTGRLAIWRYSDQMLHSEYRKKSEEGRRYRCQIGLTGGKLIRLEQPMETIVDEAGKYLLVDSAEGMCDIWERNWNPACGHKYYLEATDGTSRIFISNVMCSLSPQGKFVIYYDFKSNNYISYDVEEKKRRIITGGIKGPWSGYTDDAYSPTDPPNALAAWLKGDTAAILYDQFDLWQVDTRGGGKPINLTGGFGRKNGIVFRIALLSSEHVFSAQDTILLAAFNRRTKDNGFFQLEPGKKQIPVKLAMGPYVYEIFDREPGPPEIGGQPIKALNRWAFIVSRMRASEAPNYFYTTDFRYFTRLSDLHPERSYNWMSSQLISWRDWASHNCQGILYRPENFNASHKYPLIVTYYDKVSNNLNAYLTPEAATGPINIPWFVSHGYLVFTPDINYIKGRPGFSSLSAVVSGTKYLCQNRCVDSAHIGLYGHSFGGFHTNYIIAHSNLFAAAISAAGIADLVSQYGSLWGNGASRQGIDEIGQVRMSDPLWGRPDLYVENSPVLIANKITTPVLMMHNREDGNVDFSQGVELFTALRRLHKKAWMLEYKGEGHLLMNEWSTKDYNDKITQYFNHFLLCGPLPEWMR